MGVSSSPQWRFTITDETNGTTANLFPGAGQDMPRPPPSTLASSTRTQDNTGSAAVGVSLHGV